MQGWLGIAALVGLAWLLSENRREIRLRTVVVALLLQFALAAALFKLPLFKTLFLALNDLILALDRATTAGTALVFGYLGGGDLPFAEPSPGSAFILAFRALPLVLVISALSSLLFHWRILPQVVRGFSWLLRRTLRVGGAVGVGAAANVFVGMIEAPLLVRPYLRQMSRSELFILMNCGMSTIAGTVLVLYSIILQGIVPDPLGHILTASIISAPAAILIAQLMVPPGEQRTEGEVGAVAGAGNAIDAVTQGTLEGLKLLLNIVAMLIVLVALVHLANQLLAFLPAFAGQPLSLQRILGWGMAPLAWLIGVPWAEAATAGSLLGTKTILNELLAYLDLARLPAGALGERSRLIMTYALCGFANFGSLGIMIGGLGAMVPERREEVVSLGVKSIVAGTLTTCMTGAVIGILWAS